jgi:hypothetical protein
MWPLSHQYRCLDASIFTYLQVLAAFFLSFIPRWSMYGIFTYTCPKKWPSFVGKYSIHQASIGSFYAKVISVGIDAVAVCNWKNTCGRCGWSDRGWGLRFPICSMYSIFTYIWIIYGVNVGRYSIHGEYGSEKEGCLRFRFALMPVFWCQCSSTT